MDSEKGNLTRLRMEIVTSRCQALAMTVSAVLLVRLIWKSTMLGISICIHTERRPGTGLRNPGNTLRSAGIRLEEIPS